MNDISELLEKFLSDPAAAKAAAELAGKLMQGSTNAQTSAPENTDPPPAAQKTEDMLSAVLTDPEFMQKMPQMLSALAPMLQNATPKAQTALPHLPPSSASDQARRSALLLALKPYLTPERAETVDHIIRLTQLVELFSLLNKEK